MAALRDQVVADTLAAVRVLYLNRQTAVWWNSRRDKDEPAVFTGWYWVLGQQEAGPFKTRSAAIRDAYYANLLRRALPKVGHEAAKRMDEVSRPARKARRSTSAGVRP